MLKEWQFNVLFWVGVGGAVLILVGPSIGLDEIASPASATGVGAILTYVLTQKKSLVVKSDQKKNPPTTEKEGEDGNH